jgi:hypothetical protein
MARESQLAVVDPHATGPTWLMIEGNREKS